MSIKTILLFIFLLFVQNLNSQENESLLIDQKKIIADLSGHSALNDGTLIQSRSTKKEREATVGYLAELIKTLDLAPQIQKYKYPNVNPIVDILFDPFKGANVYSVLPSTNGSDEYIVLGGHFDSERNCPGAIDNATGIAIGYGVVKKLSELKFRSKNVILVYFDQEEEDLIGSQVFARMLKKKKFNIHSVHTMDTMGWDRDGDQAIELELPSAYIKKVYTQVGLSLGIPIHFTNVNSTDHHSFRELGFNAVGLTDELVNGDYAPFKDTPKDVYDTVNFGYVASTTLLVSEVLKEMLKG